MTYFHQLTNLVSNLRFQEILLKKDTNSLDDRDYRSAVNLVMARETFAPNPKKELLRPAQQPQDDTLLRATQYTDEKAQEQLLRPTTDDPHSSV